MDETIANWIIEYLLRKKVPDKLIDGVMSILPLNNDYRLKKTILLRRIESEVLNGDVAEKLLDLIERIETLYHEHEEENGLLSDLMKEAFCAVAVDCTARFLEEGGEKENKKFLEKLESVWRVKVCNSMGLVSEEAMKWFEDLEMAVKDGGVYEKVMRRNTRNEALGKVKKWVKAEWEELGPPVLDVVAAKAERQVEELSYGGGEDAGNTCREMIPLEGRHKGRAPPRRKHVAVKRRRSLRGAKISDAEEDVINKAADITSETEMLDATGEVSGVEEATRSSLIEPPTMREYVVGDLKMVRPLSFRRPVGLEVKEPVVLESPEVERVRKTLNDSTRQLHSAVSDPLPEALQAAQTLLSTMAGNSSETAAKQTGPGAPTILEIDRMQEVQGMANKTRRNDRRNNAVLPKQATPQEQSPNDPKPNGKEIGENQGSMRSPLSPDPKRQENGLKRSLMEANGTGHTFEWDDSIENSSASPVRPRLRSPTVKTRNSPLKPSEDRKFQKRRERRKWSVQEEDTLRTGVRKFGKGNWKLIKDCYHDVFQHRTDVDLKDKWRNLEKFPTSIHGV